MLLSRLALNPARRGCRQLLASPHRMHAAVLAAFPPDSPVEGDEGRLLWRVDRDEQRRVELYVASPASPDFTHLVEQAGWPQTTTWESRDYDRLLGQLKTGQLWGFRLTANPVRRARPSIDEYRRLSAHRTVAQQRDWLLSRAAAHGFQVTSGPRGEPNVEVRDRRTVAFAREASTVTLAMASFDGMLEVTDVPALSAALTRGIGRAKGYGCGLLTLARLP